jgi:hypothetical protein
MTLELPRLGSTPQRQHGARARRGNAGWQAFGA